MEELAREGGEVEGCKRRSAPVWFNDASRCGVKLLEMRCE